MFVNVDGDVLAEMRQFNEAMLRAFASTPPANTVRVEETRRRRREGDGVFPPPTFLPQAETLTIPSRSGELMLRVVAPESEPIGIFIHFHGGGFVLGRADERDPYLWTFARDAGVCVLSVDYRLAPEHRFPAAHEDAEDAALWILEHAPEAVNAPARFAIGGDSAGATLAVDVLQRLRDRHALAGAIDAAALVCGVFDFSGTPSRRAFPGDLMLTQELMEWFRECYMPGLSVERRMAPDVSPLYGDLRDLPPVLLTAATRDPFLDDSLFLHARWRAAGCESEIGVYPEAGHVFTVFPLQMATLANRRACAFIAEHLAP
jgi:acetyl esterase